jgi:hypothetical protein
VRDRVENAQLPQPKEMSRVVQVHLTTHSGKAWMDEDGTVNLWRRIDALAKMEALRIGESSFEEDSGGETTDDEVTNRRYVARMRRMPIED